MIEWLIILLPLAAASGWYAGQKQLISDKKNKIPHDYFVGINYLINEQPDQAVDVFIKMLEMDSDTVEIHLALGNLFRRRGEVDRAIRIHQNLIARPQLNKTQRTQALIALAQDYLRAGVFDRAERLFLEVVNSGELTKLSLRYLLDIYQQQKLWEQALVTAKKLQASGEVMTVPMAHYFCELAQESYAKGNIDTMQQQLKKALAIDPFCVRASLLQGEAYKQRGQYKAAIEVYKLIKEQDPAYLSEAIGPLANCFLQINNQEEFIQYLWNCLAEHPRISIVLLLAEHLQTAQDQQAAANFIAEQLKLKPSIKGLQRLIELQLLNVDNREQSHLMLLQAITQNLLSNKPIYRCQHCGFNGKTLHWLCPGCKSWSTIKPIQGVEGD